MDPIRRNPIDYVVMSRFHIAIKNAVKSLGSAFVAVAETAGNLDRVAAKKGELIGRIVQQVGILDVTFEICERVLEEMNVDPAIF